MSLLGILTAPIGTVRGQATGSIGEAGKPLYVYFVHVVSNASGAGVVALGDGTSGSNTTYVTCRTSGASTASYYDFGASGMYFPDGLYISTATNTSGVGYFTIVYSHVAPC